MTGDAVPLSVNQLNGVNGFKVAVAGTSVTIGTGLNLTASDFLVI